MLTKYVLMLLCLICCNCAVLSQDMPKGELDRDRITAGQTFHLKVTFPEAPSYDTYTIQAFWYSPTKNKIPVSNPVTISCGGRAVANNPHSDLACTVPTDADGGIYEAIQEFRLGPVPNGTREKTFKINVGSIEVIPLEDKNVYPTSAVATISLDQKNLLLGGASKFGSLLDQLNTRVEGHSAETAELKAYLLDVASTGKSELGKIAEQYRQLLPKEKKEPIFFEDFDRQFDDYIKGLRAPKSDNNQKAQNGESAHLQFVQLTSKETITVHPSPTDSSLGPFVQNLAILLANVRDALKTIADTGSDTFTISLRSTPAGATISYKRLLEPYQDYSRPTDVDQATFPYAMWTFRFTINGCCVIKRPNPYIEKSPNLDPQMNECQKVSACKAK